MPESEIVPITLQIVESDYTDKLIQGSTVIRMVSNQRWTANFSIKSLDGMSIPVEGMSVILKENGVSVFTGSIDQTEIVKYVHESGNIAVRIDIICLDLTARLDQRLVAPPQVFTSGTSGEALVAMMNQNAFSEFITYALVGSGGFIHPGITLTADAPFIADHIYILVAAENLARLSGYNLYIDGAGNLHYEPSGTVAAPFEFTNVSNNFTKMVIRRTREDFFNEAFNKSAYEWQPVTVTPFIGNGVAQSWTLPGLAGLVKAVKVDGELMALGLPGEDQMFTWTPGLASIVRDPALAPLAAGVTIDVEWYALGSNFHFASSPASVINRGAIEGNSGKYQIVIEDSSETNGPRAADRAEAAVSRGTQMPRIPQVVCNGFQGPVGVLAVSPRVGMTVHIAHPDLGVDDTYFIQEVNARHVPRCGFEYTVQLVDGSRFGNATDFFQGLLGGSASNPGGGSGTVVTPGGEVPPPAISDPEAPISVILSETPSSRVIDTSDQTAHLQARIVVKMSAANTATLYDLYLTPSPNSADLELDWIGTYPLTDGVDDGAGNFDFTLDLPRWVPQFDSTWFARVHPGHAQYQPNEAVSTTSAGVVILGLQAPLSTSIFFFDKDPVTVTPYFDVSLMATPDGVAYWGLPDGLTYVVAATPADPHGKEIQLTVQYVDSAGNPAPVDQDGSEKNFHLDPYLPGATVTHKDALYYNFNPQGSIHEYARFRLYINDRNHENGKQTLNAEVTFRFGPLPAGLLQGNRLDLNTLGKRVTVVDGKLVSTGNADSLMNDYDFELSRVGAIAGPTVVGAWQYLSTAEIFEDGTSNAGLRFCRITGPLAAAFQRVTFRAGESALLDVYLRSSITTPGVGEAHQVLIFISWYDANDVFISTIGLIAPSGFVGPWTRYTAEVAIPANAVSGDVVAQNVANEPAAGYWDIDSFVVKHQMIGKELVDSTVGASKVKTGPGLEDDGSDNIIAALDTPLTFLAGKITVAAQGISSAYLGAQAVQASNMAANAITLANGAIAANTVVDNNIIDVGVAKLIHGTKIFTGDVFLSRGSAAPIMALANTGIVLYGVANGPGTNGLTSQPHVIVNSTGILLLQSTTGASTLITASGTTLYSANGNTTQPYIALTAFGGIELVNSGFKTAITAAQIRLSSNLGPTLTLDTSEVAITNGSYAVKIRANAIQLWSINNNTSFPYVGIDQSAMYLGAGSFLTTISSSKIRMEQTGGVSLELTAASGLVIQNGSFAMRASASSIILEHTSGSKLTLLTTSLELRPGAGLAKITMDNTGLAQFTSSLGTSSQINGNSIITGFLTMTSLTFLTGGVMVFPASFVSGVANAGAIAPPANVAGYLIVSIAGVNQKIPYYNV
jgi:hypothetical protein